MALWHLRSRKKPTGGRLHRLRNKRRTDRGSLFIDTKIGKTQLAKKRVTGGSVKLRLKSAESVNVADPKTGKVTKVPIISVKGNDANPHYVRRNVITLGALIETKLGTAKVTSRPGQDGIVNAVLLEEKK
ncbi:MAG: 30S ribosomal protein S8e [Candidatus Aenigmarchaeota archaeon]|nr:30S ribosomal protein S8e [Candidatus Aenigmarchaeota archaeon]